MNTIDLVYQDLLQAIITSGVEKKDRTGTGTKSIFGYQIRHDMQSGFPLLTTKKMAWKQIVTELLWFLRGDTNIKYLVDNDCHIWDGDCYKNYWEHNKIQSNPKWLKPVTYSNGNVGAELYNMEEFINKIKTDDEFAKKWGELGPIYGKQWRSWGEWSTIDEPKKIIKPGVDQIANLINDLKTNPDSRRLMVNAWNVGELDQMVLPPCHYGFQVYTRELNSEEIYELADEKRWELVYDESNNNKALDTDDIIKKYNIPTRAISLMWNQRSVDTFLGLPFNIASYGLLLEIIAKAVNMVPDELIGNLGDVHLYSNHIEQAKEQIGRELTLKERIELWEQLLNKDVMDFPIGPLTDEQYHTVLSSLDIPRRTREPYPLPTLKIVGYPDEYNYPHNEKLFDELEPCDLILENYQSHPTIKAPLSN